MRFTSEEKPELNKERERERDDISSHLHRERLMIPQEELKNTEGGGQGVFDLFPTTAPPWIIKHGWIY